MTDTTNPTAKYSKNYSGDVGETPKSMAGTWHLEAPDGRRWAGSCPINCVAQELAERVPVQVQLARVLAIADEPDLDERHAKLGVEYGTVKVDELVDKLQAERDELRAKLDELARQRPCGYLPYGYVGRSAMVYGQPVPESVPIYLVAGASPVEPAPAAVAGPSDWRELAAKVMDVLADAQESTNAAYPDHVSCYPEWETQARWLRWHAEMFRTGKPTGNGAGQPAVLAALAATPTTQPAPAAHKEQT